MNKKDQLPQNQNQNQENPEETGSSLEEMEKLLYIRDDAGFAWTFKGGLIIRVTDMDLEIKRAYLCDSLEEGIAILNKVGIITPAPIVI